MILESVLEHKRQLKKQQEQLQRQKSFKFKFQRRETQRTDESGETAEKIEICKKYTS